MVRLGTCGEVDEDAAAMFEGRSGVDGEEVEVVLELRVIEVNEAERPNNRCLRWQLLDLTLPAAKTRANMTPGIHAA
jgi:hypothetical protein